MNNQTKQTHQPKMVEIRLHLHIAEHDLEIKAKKIEESLIKKHQVRIRITLMGREKSRPQLGVDFLNRLIERFSEVGKPNRLPTTDNLNVVLFPKSKTH